MVQRQIELILTDLSKRDNLTESEQKFKEDAKNEIIIDITEKENPQVFIWENKDGSLAKLISSRFRYCDDDHSNEEYHENKETLDSKEGLRADLNEYLELLNQVGSKGADIRKNYKVSNNSHDGYNFNQQLDYATKGSIDGLINQFGYHKGEDCVPTIL